MKLLKLKLLKLYIGLAISVFGANFIVKNLNEYGFSQNIVKAMESEIKDNSVAFEFETPFTGKQKSIGINSLDEYEIFVSKEVNGTSELIPNIFFTCYNDECLLVRKGVIEGLEKNFRGDFESIISKIEESKDVEEKLKELREIKGNDVRKFTDNKMSSEENFIALLDIYEGFLCFREIFPKINCLVREIVYDYKVKSLGDLKKLGNNKGVELYGEIKKLCDGMSEFKGFYAKLESYLTRGFSEESISYDYMPKLIRYYRQWASPLMIMKLFIEKECKDFVNEYSNKPSEEDSKKESLEIKNESLEKEKIGKVDLDYFLSKPFALDELSTGLTEAAFKDLKKDTSGILVEFDKKFKGFFDRLKERHPDVRDVYAKMQTNWYGFQRIHVDHIYLGSVVKDYTFRNFKFSEYEENYLRGFEENCEVLCKKHSYIFSIALLRNFVEFVQDVFNGDNRGALGKIMWNLVSGFNSIRKNLFEILPKDIEDSKNGIYTTNLDEKSESDFDAFCKLQINVHIESIALDRLEMYLRFLKSIKDSIIIVSNKRPCFNILEKYYNIVEKCLNVCIRAVERMCAAYCLKYGKVIIEECKKEEELLIEHPKSKESQRMLGATRTIHDLNSLEKALDTRLRLSEELIADVNKFIKKASEYFNLENKDK